MHGQANPKIEMVQDENPALELIEGDLRDLSSLIARRRAGAARRGLQPRRDQLRAALVQAGRAHRGDHRPRRAAHARSRPHRRRHRQQPDPLLPGVVVGDVRQGAARRRRPRRTPFHPRSPYGVGEGVRSLHDDELPRGLRHPREQRHPLQPRRAEARPRVRDAQGHERRSRASSSGCRTASRSATSTRRATGATRATTSRRCG